MLVFQKQSGLWENIWQFNKFSKLLWSVFFLFLFDGLHLTSSNRNSRQLTIKDIKDTTKKIENQDQGKKKANILTTGVNIVINRWIKFNFENPEWRDKNNLYSYQFLLKKIFPWPTQIGELWTFFKHLSLSIVHCFASLIDYGARDVGPSLKILSHEDLQTSSSSHTRWGHLVQVGSQDELQRVEGSVVLSREVHKYIGFSQDATQILWHQRRAGVVWATIRIFFLSLTFTQLESSP